MYHMNRIFDRLITTLAIVGVILTAPISYAVVNVLTRPEMVSIVLETPNNRRGIVQISEPIDNDAGLGGPPAWYVDYEKEISYHADIPNAHYNTRTYTAQEHACLAQNIYFEARNESLRGQIAVALVTLERVEDPRYPNDVCGVVYENKQFSWYWDGLSDRPKNLRKYTEVALVTSAVLANDTAIYDYTYGSTHYHADYVNPYWAEYMVRKAKVDTHIFYREEPESLASL